MKRSFKYYILRFFETIHFFSNQFKSLCNNASFFYKYFFLFLCSIDFIFIPTYAENSQSYQNQIIEEPKTEENNDFQLKSDNTYAEISLEGEASGKLLSEGVSNSSFFYVPGKNIKNVDSNSPFLLNSIERKNYLSLNACYGNNNFQLYFLSQLSFPKEKKTNGFQSFTFSYFTLNELYGKINVNQKMVWLGTRTLKVAQKKNEHLLNFDNPLNLNAVLGLGIESEHSSFSIHYNKFGIDEPGSYQDYKENVYSLSYSGRYSLSNNSIIYPVFSLHFFPGVKKKWIQENGEESNLKTHSNMALLFGINIEKKPYQGNKSQFSLWFETNPVTNTLDQTPDEMVYKDKRSRSSQTIPHSRAGLSFSHRQIPNHSHFFFQTDALYFYETFIYSKSDFINSQPNLYDRSKKQRYSEYHRAGIAGLVGYQLGLKQTIQVEVSSHFVYPTLSQLELGSVFITPTYKMYFHQLPIEKEDPTYFFISLTFVRLGKNKQHTSTYETLLRQYFLTQIGIHFKT